jgi:hypothetical protein
MNTRASKNLKTGQSKRIKNEFNDGRTKIK